MIRWVVAVITLVMIQFVPATGQADFKKTKIAVLDFQLQGEGFETDDMGSIVAEWFITALVRSGRFDVVERGMLNKILEEQKLGMTGVVDESTATKIGKLLGVQAIISGAVLKLKNVLQINARIIDVETASIKAAENVQSQTVMKLQELVDEMSIKIIRNFPLEGYVVRREKDSVFIDLGETAGVKTGMHFVVYKEGDVIKHPKTGEILDVERKTTGQLQIVDVREKISEAKIVKEETPGAIIYGQMVYNLADSSAMRFADSQPPPPEKGRLYVRPQPDTAKIRILNIGPRYIKGMELSPGKYHIEVSAPGYETKTLWTGLEAGETKHVDISLEQSRTIASGRAAPSASPSPSGGSTQVTSFHLAGLTGAEKKYIRLLRSKNVKDIVGAARRVIRSDPTNPHILAVVNAELLKGYAENSQNRNHADAMSWLCKVLGASGQSEYKSTLSLVAQKGSSRKLRKYALQSLRQLDNAR
jgi:TolB-like protein